MKKIILSLLLVLTIAFTATSVFASDSVNFSVTFDANGGTYTHPYANSLKNRISSGIPTKILFIGDSTGNGDDEWIYLFSEALAEISPKNSVSYRLWNDANLGYDAPVKIQEGVLGDGYAYVENGFNITTADKPSLRFTSDFEITVKAAPDVWANGDAQTLVNKFGAAGNRGYSFYINGSGGLSLWLSNDGTENEVINSDIPVPSSIDGSPLYLRVKYDADNGAGGNTTQFFVSTDGITFSKIGNDVVIAGIRNVYASTESLSFGARGSSSIFEGKIYSATLKNANDKVVASLDLSKATTPTTISINDEEDNLYTFYGDVILGTGSPLLTILNASHPGARFDYFTDSNVFNKISSNDIDALFINLSHNEGIKSNLDTEIISLLNLVYDKSPDVNVILSSQNPQKTPSTISAIQAHKLRNESISIFAQKNKFGFIDAYSALSSDVETNVYTDGVHPTAAGSEIWAATAMNFMDGTQKHTLMTEYNKTVVLPDNPVREGYIFSGWFTTPQLTTQFTKDTKVIEDMTVYAKWVPNSGGGGVPVSGSDITLSPLMIALIIGGAALVGYLFFTDKGRKSIGLK